MSNVALFSIGPIVQNRLPVALFFLRLETMHIWKAYVNVEKVSLRFFTLHLVYFSDQIWFAL